MSKVIPDDPRMQLDLADKWSKTLDFSDFDRADEPGAWNLVHSLGGIEKSCRALLDEHLPNLMSASGERDVLNALIDVGVELGHLTYHIRDARFFDRRLIEGSVVPRTE